MQRLTDDEVDFLMGLNWRRNVPAPCSLSWVLITLDMDHQDIRRVILIEIRHNYPIEFDSVIRQLSATVDERGKPITLDKLRESLSALGIEQT